MVRGTMRFRAEIQPRFDYGRKPHKLELHDDAGALFRFRRPDPDAAPRRSPGRSLHEEGTSLERDGDGLRLTKTMREGETAGVVMDSAGDPPKAVHPQELVELFDDTVRFWRGWLSRSTYNGRWQEQVARSAMTLKLMTYAPSGGLVAALTAALPEQVGGERNWDYRYTWIRDASFSVYALLGLGYTDEAAAFGWLRDRIREQAGESSGPLKIMYRVDGSSDLEEEASTTSRATAGPAQYASATTQPISCSSTSMARRWIPSISPTPTACKWGTKPGPGSRTCSTGSASTGISPRRASGRLAEVARTSPTVG